MSYCEHPRHQHFKLSFWVGRKQPTFPPQQVKSTTTLLCHLICKHF
uniref:Uncharacterized protein n=1 Tax=Calidris pygmaea TaxID=425635 RepID=A0A8C3KJB2_9CHAR